MGYLLQRWFLDLRNFDKIHTKFLERFNELFTGMKTLTLNED